MAQGSSEETGERPSTDHTLQTLDAHTCQHCQRIVIRHDDIEKHKLEMPQLIAHAYIVYLPHTRSEALIARREGCPFFLNYAVVEAEATKASSLAALLKGQAISKHPLSSHRGKIQGLDYAKQYGRYLQFALTALLSRRLYMVISPASNQIRMGPGGLVNVRLGEYHELYKQPRDVGSPLPGRLLYPTRVQSGEAFIDARRQLEVCCNLHRDTCSREVSAFKPSRLLYVGGDVPVNHVRLIDSKSIPGPSDWCALSYVWGGPQPLETTTSTLSAHLTGLDFRDLPKTLGDGITVCRGLGVSYLWIDCLCIIQDDNADKIREMAAMPRIYEDAFVVISAASSGSVKEGFLQNRPMIYGARHAPPVLLRYEDEASTQRDIVIGDSLLNVPAFQVTNPIESRAWTFQESLLSTRMLVYSAVEMKYICRNHVTHLTSSQFKTEFHTWYRTVEEYSGRGLTHGSDKLVAISAVADLYRRNFSKTYEAGMWREDLPRSLCWGTSWRQDAQRRSVEYRAPSWSWAAIDTRVQFDKQYWKTETMSDVIAELVDVSVESDPPNTTFGAIREASITLRGLASWRTLDFSKGRLWAGGCDGRFIRWDAVDDKWVRVEAGVQVLMMAVLKTINEELVQGLVLVRVGDNSYRRVGMFSMPFISGHEAWADESRSWEPQTVTIH